jgi:hypothetical protein
MKPSFGQMKTFVPAKDFEYSRRFYAEIFDEDSLAERVCGFRVGDSAFLLQDFYEPEFARNCTYRVPCKDVQAVFNFLSEIVAKYDGPSVRPPKLEPWGKVVYLFGPSGELWQFANASS